VLSFLLTIIDIFTGFHQFHDGQKFVYIGLIEGDWSHYVAREKYAPEMASKIKQVTQ